MFINCSLFRCDFADSEIDMFFGLSDANGDGEITTDVRAQNNQSIREN